MRSVDPGLVGGLVLKAGSLEVDSSVRGRLDRLRQRTRRKEPASESPTRRDHLDPAQADRALRRRDRPRRGRHRPPGRRRHRARLRPRDRPSRWRCSSSSTASPASRSTSRRTTSAAPSSANGTLIKEGDSAKRTGRVASVPVGEALIGRIVDPLGNPLDGGPPIETDERARARDQGAGRHRPPAGEGAAPDRHQGDRRDDERRPRPARADHRRPLDGQDGDPRRHDPEPARPGRDLHLRRDRAEGLDRRADPRAAQGPRRDGVHDHRHGARLRGRSDQVDGALRGLRDGRVLHEQGRPRARHVRRPVEARRRLPADVAAPAAAARPRGLPRRRLLPPLAPARAREQALGRARRRLADGAAGGRDAGGRHRRVHPDERDLDHRRADLPRGRSLLLGRPPGGRTSAARSRASARAPRRRR